MRTIDCIKRSASVAMADVITRIEGNLSRFHILACLDEQASTRNAEPNRLAQRGLDLATAWYDFMHVYVNRTSALAVHNLCPLRGIGIYWIASGGKQWHRDCMYEHVRKTIDDPKAPHGLRNNGMATLSVSVEDSDFGPFVSPSKVAKGGFKPWHVFIMVGTSAVLSSYVRVLNALCKAKMKITIDLAPPVVLKTASGVARGRPLPYIRSKTKSCTVHGAHVITWEYLAVLLDAHCMLYPGEQLTVPLVGSLMLAIVDDGPMASGGVFQELTRLGLVGNVPNITVAYSAKYGNAALFATLPNGADIAETIRCERAMLQTVSERGGLGPEFACLAHLAIKFGFGGTGMLRDAPMVSSEAIVGTLGAAMFDVDEKTRCADVDKELLQQNITSGVFNCKNAAEERKAGRKK